MAESINIRDTFLPDEDCVMVRCDLSQIEDRICKMYCGTERMVELANRRPSVYDAHTDNAVLIFQKGASEITKQERYLGKRTTHACCDDQTEVLTTEGFVPFPKLSLNCIIAEYNVADHTVQFKRPKQIFVYPYNGEMHHYTSQASEQMVTPEHRIPYYTRWKPEIQVKKSSKLINLRDVRVPVVGKRNSPVLPVSDDDIRLVVSAQADACYRNNYYYWRFKKARKIARLVLILNNLGIAYNKRKYKSGVTAISISVADSQRLSWGLENKSFKFSLFQLSHKQREVFLNELVFWDGYRQTKNSFSYFSRDKQSCDVVNVIAFLTGYRSYVKVSPRDEQDLTVRICKHKFTSVRGTVVDYVGDVYCVETTTGCFVTRRNGKIAVTGNSQRGMAGQRLCENIMKDTKGELYIHPKQCDKLIERYLENMWEIRDIYFSWVRERLREDGVLVNSWGRRLDLRGVRITEDLYREAYSYYMQSECADWTNQYGFIPATWWMVARYGRPLNAQVHDEVIASTPLADAWEYARFIVSSFEQIRMIPSCQGALHPLCVPAEVTVARSWGDKRAIEFVELPERDDFYHELWKGGFFDGSQN